MTWTGTGCCADEGDAQPRGLRRWFWRWPADNPAGPTNGVFRVLRGGAAYNLLFGRNAELARSARRVYGHPDLRHAEIGFRVVVEAGGE